MTASIPQEETNQPTPSIKLCDIIISYRYLHILEQEAKDAMVELAARRAAGDPFDFEKHINDTLQSLPKIKLDMKSIMSIPGLSNLVSIFNGKK